MKKLTTLAFALLLAHQVSAILTFSVDAVSADSITLTVTNGSTVGGPDPDAGTVYLMFDSVSDVNFVTADNEDLGAASGSIGGIAGSPTSTGRQSGSGAPNFGDLLTLEFSSGLSIGGAASSVTNTFTDAGLDFNAFAGALTPANVGADLRLSWGFSTDGGLNLGTVQSVGAVPEPSTYAVLLGLAAFGMVVCCRRRM